MVDRRDSFWSSYRAALEWLGPSGTLTPLADIPVLSQGDGIDGAYDLAVRGDQVFVANCESGLLRGLWEEDAVELEKVSGPWAPDGECSPQQVELAEDVLVLAGTRLDFVRPCR